MRLPARTTAVVVLASLVTLVLGYVNKARCAGPPFSDLGRSLKFESLKNVDVCYSDIQYLWIGRDIDNHVFPFLHGGITPSGSLFGGTVEYPVLSGLLMWLGGIGSHTDAAFLLHSAIILAPFGLLTAWLLGRISGWRALWWSLSPALVLFAFHNWDLPAVATTVAAAYVMMKGPGSLRTRGMIAAALLAVGACLKLYPGLFVLPVALAVLWGPVAQRAGRTPDDDGGATVRRSGPLDVRGALSTVGVAVGTAAAINLPFAVLGLDGWLASFAFQGNRTADITTNSIWYWGLRPLIGDDDAYNSVVSIASPVLVVASFVLALWIGVRIARRTGTYPWLQVSAAMLCGFLLLHKVHSPQYVLWILPFFVLLRVRWQVVIGYLAANTALGIGLFRYYDALGTDPDVARRWEYLVWFGVWGQAVLLAVLFVVFLRTAPSGGDAPGQRPLRPPQCAASPAPTASDRTTVL
ncbi:glycosyltransferase family 87 protein [Tomitella fengzijianii]|uniref:DUF2029 domain-containing protein n=1 Tax=Tomitella fengzijianii TaxID=2597660 RepID=A0A516X6Y4_9ACTN|nr:glycosyltransferase 87 family protein [Tomitella fengzijianii]QDQ98834.1 DUF2029 domain-containing protein [Tomitella fengzijianii]